MNPVKPPISPGDHGPLIADLHAALRAMIDNAYLNTLAFIADAQDVIQQGLPAESEADCNGPAAQLFVARLQGFIGAADSSSILAASAPGSSGNVTVAHPPLALTVVSPLASATLTYQLQVDASSPIGVGLVASSTDGGKTWSSLVRQDEVDALLVVCRYQPV